MPAPAKQDARLNFRLPLKMKAEIEEAAASLGQSVNDFAVTALVRTARSVLQQHTVTELTNRDRDLFMALLDNDTARPNKALARAAKKYKKYFGR